jgi:hypothetical protein
MPKTHTYKRFILGVLLACPVWASADYQVFQYPDPLSGTTNMVGTSLNTPLAFEIIGTSTVTLFDRVTMPFCRSGGAEGGYIQLEIRSTTTTGPIIASSTLSVNAGNVWSTGCASAPFENATSSTWVFNNTLQYVADVHFFVIATPRDVDPLSTFYWTYRKQASASGYGKIYNANPLVPYTITGDYVYVYAKGYALGSTPTNQGQGIYNASSTAALCTSFDIGCYLSNAFAWAFYPTITLSDQLADLASTTNAQIPFGYATDVGELINTIFTQATTSLNISVEISGLLNFMNAGYSSTSMTLLSGTALRSTMGSSIWSFIQNILKGLFWLGFAFYTYRRAIHFL